MKDVIIRAKKKKREPRGVSWIYVVFLVIGVLGLLLMAHSVEKAAFSVPAAFMASCLEAILLACAYKYAHAVFARAAAISAAILGLVIYVYADRISEEAVQFGKCVIKWTGLASADTTFLACIFALCITFLLFMAECVLGRHLIVCLLTSALMIIAPVAGITVSFAGAGCILAFQTAFSAFGIRGAMSAGRAFLSDKRAASSVNGVFVSCLAIIALVAAAAAAKGHADIFYKAVDRAEGAASTYIKEATGISEAIGADGDIGAGNNYRTTTKKFTVSVRETPERPLYLASFRGGAYKGNSFDAAEDTTASGDSVEIDNIYYILKDVEEAAKGNYGEPPDVGRGKIMYIDYGSNEAHGDVHPYDFVYVGFFSSSSGESIIEASRIIISYYDTAGFTVDTDNINMGSDSADRYYRNLIDRYKTSVSELYTAVPTGYVPKLEELVRDNPLSSLDDITSFIIYTLNSSCTYTLQPGMAPLNEDIVDYFLFERGSGYCEQYAAAATLMYRLYGIPARYVSGYRIDYDDWYEGDVHTGINIPGLNGGFNASADVSELNAHAWVELYSPEKGWYPVEVTPAADGSFPAPYEGLDVSEIASIMQEKGWDINVPSIESIRQRSETAPSSGIRLPEGTVQNTLYAMWGFLLAAPLTALCIISDRRKKLMSMNAGRSFARLTEMAHACGMLTERDGTERDFADAFSEAFGVEAEEIKSIQALAFKSSFSSPGTSEEEDAKAMKTLKSAEDAMRSSLPLPKRIAIRIFSL